MVKIDEKLLMIKVQLALSAKDKTTPSQIKKVKQIAMRMFSTPLELVLDDPKTNIADVACASVAVGFYLNAVDKRSR